MAGASGTRVLCVGAAVHDTIAVVERMPEPDGRVRASQILQSPGGPAATSAAAIARLGGDVAFAGVMGTEPESELLMTDLEKRGVSTSLVDRSGRTAHSVVLVSTSSSSRAIVAEEPCAPQLRAADLAGFEWVHVDHSGYGAVHELADATDRGWRLSVDGGNPIDDLDLQRVDLYAPTVGVLRQMFGDMSPSRLVKEAVRAGASAVVATDGAGGAYYATQDDEGHVPSFPIDVVSTLGAGDVFHGGLVFGLAEGQTLSTAVQTGCATAALSCRGIDGRSALPDLPELNQFIDDQTQSRSIDVH